MYRILARPIVSIAFGLLAVAFAYAALLLDVANAAAVLAPVLLAFGASAVLAGMLSLAARRPFGTPRALRTTIRLAFAATFGGLLYAIFAAPPTADDPLLLGLPRVTAVMLLVTGLIPLVVLPLAYARAFARDVLGEEEIARIAELARDIAAERGASQATDRGPTRDA